MRCYLGFSGTSASLALTVMVAAAVLRAPPCARASQELAAAAIHESDSVKLTDSQLGSIAVARVAEREFLVEKARQWATSISTRT